jgi:hypothetical protein
MRPSYYRDSYGQVYEDRQAEGRSGMSASWAVVAVVVLAAIVVLASFIH